MIDCNGNKILWQHIVDLYEHQKLTGFRLANKITKQHVMFEKNSMKVKFAAQLISQSVANALLTMNQLKMSKFEQVHATVDYLKLFDSLFDVMNSRSQQRLSGKAPLQECNEGDWQSLFHKAVFYICHLKTKNGKNVLKSERYASFLGIVSTTI
jgi:hypothetical protein